MVVSTAEDLYVTSHAGIQVIDANGRVRGILPKLQEKETVRLAISHNFLYACSADRLYQSATGGGLAGCEQRLVPVERTKLSEFSGSRPLTPPISELLPLRFQESLLADAESVRFIEVKSVTIVPFENHELLIVKHEVWPLIEGRKDGKGFFQLLS
jgi:hypothetical protein